MLTNTGQLVVGKSSATMGVPGELSRIVNADHRTICKYQSRKDPNYRTVLNMIKSLVENFTVEGLWFSTAKWGNEDIVGNLGTLADGIIDSTKRQSLSQSSNVETTFFKKHLDEALSPTDGVNVNFEEDPFSVFGNEDTTVSGSASRPSGGTQQTYGSSVGYQGVVTDPTLYSCDKSECEVTQPDECERIQAQPAEHQQSMGLYTTKTEYSVSNGSQNERYITDLATDLFEAVKTYHSGLDALERLSELLPDLLRAFAVKIGHQTLSQTDLDIAYFIQKHREYITTAG